MEPRTGLRTGPGTGSRVELRVELRAEQEIAQREQPSGQKHHRTKLPTSKPELSKDNPPMMEEHYSQLSSFSRDRQSLDTDVVTGDSPVQTVASGGED
jgi:hypothetical protein